MKPIVYYYAEDVVLLGAGIPAIVRTIDHYDTANVSNQSYVRTTPVVSYDDLTGEFETMNSRYVPRKLAS